MINISDKRTNETITFVQDDRNKMMLGYTSYYSDNVSKYKETVKQFSDKLKVYKVLSPYNYKMIKDINDKTIDIYDAVSKKFNVNFDKQIYYQLIELIKKFNITSVYSDIDETKDVCKALKVKYEPSANTIILKALNVDLINKLSKNGTAIIKIKHILTTDTLVIVNALCRAFNNVSIYIPKTVDSCSGSKYLICKNMTSRVNISYSIDVGIMKYIIELNNSLITEQTVNINNTINYINKRNYYGEEYNNYLQKQKECHNKWIDEYVKK